MFFKITLPILIYSTLSGVFAMIVFQYKHAAQQSVQLTAFGVGVLAFVFGFISCWLMFVDKNGGN